MRKTATKKAKHTQRRSAASRKTRGGNRKKPAAKRSTTRSPGPVKLVGGRLDPKPFEDRGPIGWLLPMLETAYTRIAPRDAPGPPGVQIARSSLQRNVGGTLAAEPPETWRSVLLEYKQRKAAAGAPAVRPAAAPAPFVPGARNWQPLGPTLVLNGQTVGEQPVGGRVAALAIAPGASVIYAASANGGVFRSADGGTTWRSLMDRFDLDPTSFASSSLACGAIAVDANDPNRVYVGTGEGDTFALFSRRITNALPAYRGVGPIRTDDGGNTWVAEPSTPDLAGQAFFALAIDPRDRDNVIGATSQGLYRRLKDAGGNFAWSSVARDGVYCSVVVTAKDAVARFFAARWGADLTPSGIVYSDDGGATWQPAGSGLPADGIGRIALGVQASDPNLIYVFAAAANGAVNGLYRLDDVAGQWEQVTALPDVLPVGQGGGSQGDYDIAVAVDPADANLVYLAGSYANINPFPASIWRCPISTSGEGFVVNNPASIGTHAHADVHSLAHTPATPNELWCTCDGGVFLNRDPRNAGEFASQNSGLACLCTNFIGQHPTDPNILFCGLQDNGTARTDGGPVWTHVGGGDGGYCVVNWADPNRVLIYANGTVFRSTTGGQTEGGWTAVWNFGWATMTQPIVTTPYEPAKPANANLVAVGSAQTVYISTDFASTWPATLWIALPDGVTGGDVFALAFASANRLFIATTVGRVYRADRSGNRWNLTRLDDVAAGPLGLTGLIGDIAVDWSDVTLNSVYVAFGGKGDDRRVWRFDGRAWEVRSGTPGATHLLDVEHNTIIVDRKAPNDVYAGADVGVWHSSDAGKNWQPLENGLPDAPVFDLQIHPSQRLLRASTHGRGVYEIALDG